MKIGLLGYYCHTKSDECVNDSDCQTSPNPPEGQNACSYSMAKQHWVCVIVPICAGETGGSSR
jgi:hypothetical protein